MRALFSPVVISLLLSAPSAFGNPLQPGPPGSSPSGNAIILTFASSANTRSSYIVDRKGFYEHNSWPSTSNSPVGAFTENGASTNGAPMSVLADATDSKGATSRTSGSLSDVAAFFGSGGGGISNNTGLAGLFGFKGLGDGSDFGAGGRGLGLLAALSNSETNGLAPGRDGSPSVSTTPLPASWTMMIIGLLGFGVLAWFRKSSDQPASR